MSHPYKSSPQKTTHHVVAVGVFFGFIFSCRFEEINDVANSKMTTRAKQIAEMRNTKLDGESKDILKQAHGERTRAQFLFLYSTLIMYLFVAMI